jgi:hypothetical protein
MKRRTSRHRRHFLKTTAAGIIAAGMSPVRVSGQTVAWTNGMQVNPAIDNLRVVYCCDPAMLKNTKLTKWDPQLVNAEVVEATVAGNMDRMAMALAKKASAGEAWATIFRKPDAKQWAQLTVAIKANCQNFYNEPRTAVINKICDVLYGFGVPYASMYLYDAVTSTWPAYGNTAIRPFLRAGIKVVDKLGDKITVVLPGGFNMSCAGWLTPGNKDGMTVDILVNIACNKGHDQMDKGGCTLTLKNHTGTIISTRQPPCPTLDEVIAENKSEFILGTPQAGVPCRQQLCIVDSLWATSANDVQTLPNFAPAYLVIGTFGGAVDYLTIKKIREPLMNAVHNPTAVNRFITDFGYSDQERLDLTAKTPEQNNGRGWVDALAATKNLNPLGKEAFAGHAELIFTGRYTNRAPEHVLIPSPANISDATIYSSRGQLLKRLDLRSSAHVLKLAWDGTTDAGAPVAPGTCVLRLNGQGAGVSHRFFLFR